MNHRGGWALIRGTWLQWLQQRGFFFMVAFGWLMSPLIYLLVWSTAAGGGMVGGMNRGAFVAYYLALILVNQLTYSTSNWTVGDLIRMGLLNPTLLRPMSPLYDALASEIAGKVVFTVFTVPAVALLALVLRPELHTTPQHALAAAVALGLAWLLRFFWGLWLALLAFWATRADALLALQDSLIFLLAGQVAPLALLPGALQTVARILPFRYMLSFPVEVLTGQVPGQALPAAFALQAGWLAVALGLTVFVWRSGLRRYTAVGG
jgi:ABC-2 type transport system permease protein